MPEYLAPGVFVEETSFRAKSIEGVGTSVAAIVGPTRYGPLRGKPEVLTSYADFVRTYGDAQDLVLNGNAVSNHTALAVRAFFDNGGKQIFLARVVGGVNDGNAEFAGAAKRATKTDAHARVKFRARFSGAYGGFTLELRWRDSQNLLSFDGTTNPDPGNLVLLSVSGVSKNAFVTPPTLADAKFPIKLMALVKAEVITENLASVPVLTIDGEKCVATDKDGEPVALSDISNQLRASKLPVGWRAVAATLVNPSSGKLSKGDLVQLNLRSSVPANLLPILGNLGATKTLVGTVDIDKKVLNFSAARNSGLVSGSVEMPWAALAVLQDYATSLLVCRRFDVDVRNGGKNGEVIATYADCSISPSGPASLAARMPENPEKRNDWLTSPVSCTLDLDSIQSGGDIYDALLDMCDGNAISHPDFDGPRYLLQLSQGSDGDAPVAADYGGESDEQNGSTGLAAFEDIEDVSIVLAPHAATLDETGHVGTVAELQKHCRKMRYRVAIIESRQGMAFSEVRDFGGRFDDSRLALYYPWIATSDPLGIKPSVLTPPSGFIAGVYAYTDIDRGVHKAPANEVVLGALRFETEINRFQQELLNPEGVNCLRSFPGRGLRVWGGRTRSSDPEWKYVNVRRYFLYLERSIEKSTQWVVFEPNGEALWDNVRQTVDSFLFNEWRNRRLLGPSPKEAYFVRCDRSTMTQNDLDNGRLVCLIGVAPLRPAEFVIFRIGQKTADA